MSINLSKLKTDFIVAMESLQKIGTVDRRKTHSLFNYLLSFYVKPFRYCHNLELLSELLSKLEEASDQLNISEKEFSTLVVSLWFQSAHYGQVMAKGGFNNLFWLLYSSSSGVKLSAINEVSELLSPFVQNKQKKESKLSKIMFDLNQSILGADSRRLNEYENQMKKESLVYKDADYKTNRIKEVRELSSCPRIFKTDFFFHKLEIIARRNIKNYFK